MIRQESKEGVRWGGGQGWGIACKKKEARKVTAGRVLKRLAGHVKDFGLHPEDNGKSLKSFRQKNTMNRFVF